MAELGIEITGELSAALTWVLGPRHPGPMEVDVLAAYLDLLAKDFGLSSRAPDVSRAERARPPAAAVAMLNAFVGDGSGSDPIDEQIFGDQLYDVLVDLSQEGHVGKLLNSTKPLTAEEIRQLGQIYWNLEGVGTRPKLPIRSTKEIGIKVPRANADFATMVWATRLKSGPAGLRDNSFRIKGARLVVLAAQWILQTRAPVPIDIKHAHFRHETSRNGEKRISAIYWSAGASEIESGSPISTDPLKGDPAINALRKARRVSATAADAADMGMSILAILERRSAASVGDHEAQLAKEYLQAGLSSVMAGRVDEAIDRFLNAQRVLETLSQLAPDDATHKLGLAAALTMLGPLYVQLGQVEDAENALTRAVAISQDLTDSDPDNEDMLALALSLLGIHYSPVDRTSDAETALRRSAIISERLSTRDPENYEKQLQFANTLMALGSFYMQAEKEKDAEDNLVRAVAASQHLVTQRADYMSRLLLASALFALGTLYLSVDREDGGEDALTRSIALSQELVKDTPEGMMHHYQGANATDVLGGALFLRGLMYQSSDREQEAEDDFTRVLALYQDQFQDLPDESLVGMTLNLLTELYRKQGRLEELEKSLLHRQRVNGQGATNPPASDP
jgi:tetratricopeptide (TPR) repeat protein